MKEVQITFKGDISRREKIRWSRAIDTAMNSLTDYEKRVVPEFKVYPTVVMSIADNFRTEDLATDSVISMIFFYGKWAYSKILSDSGIFDKNELFISLSTKLFGNFMNETPPEFIILHEVGHFQVQHRKQISRYLENRGEVEFLADKYALYALARMLYRNPGYKSISRYKKHIEFIDNMRDLLKEELGDRKPAPAELRGKLKRVANRMLTLLEWGVPLKAEYSISERDNRSKYSC